MTEEEARVLIPACGRVLAGDGWGTGYLIASDHVMTCAHVVETVPDHGNVQIEFKDSPSSQEIIVCDATVIKRDPNSDCALLQLTQPRNGVQPLPLAGTCASNAEWVSYGFPFDTMGAGLPFFGFVELINGEDDQRIPSLIVFSEKASAGMGTPMNGYSGSPVFVGGAVVGHLKRIIPDPGMGSTNPLRQTRPHTGFGSIYATPSEAVLKLSGIAPEVHCATSPERPRTIVRRQERRQIFTIWKKWSDSDQPRGEGALSAAEELIDCARPEQALEVLEYAEPGFKTEQKRALALSKAGKIENAIKVLEALRKAGHNDQETLGLLAGRYKQLWQNSGYDDRWLRKAYEACKEACKDVQSITTNTYTGINAAALALFAGNRESSKKYARAVLSTLTIIRDDQLSYWQCATMGEAYLLLKQLTQAKEWYTKAVERNPLGRDENIARMRRQARLELKKLDQPEDALDSILIIPRVVAFSGHRVDDPGRPVPRFPATMVPQVRAAISHRLQKLNVGYGFSSAARGSDIICIEELLKRHARAHVFLPFSEDEFVGTSVGDEWEPRYRDILEKGDVDLTILSQYLPLDKKQQEEAYDRCNREVHKAAITKALLLDEKPVLLTVWNGHPGDDRGGTADAARVWGQDGYAVELIDISKL